jgi:hypothetical protein
MNVCPFCHWESKDDKYNWVDVDTQIGYSTVPCRECTLDAFAQGGFS